MLVPKLCLGTQVYSKLRFEGQAQLGPSPVPSSAWERGEKGQKMFFNDETRDKLLDGSEQEIKEYIMELSRSHGPDSPAYKVSVNFLLFKYHEKLVNKTYGIVIATWVLAILNALLVVLSLFKCFN